MGSEVACTIEIGAAMVKGKEISQSKLPQGEVRPPLGSCFLGMRCTREGQSSILRGKEGGGALLIVGPNAFDWEMEEMSLNVIWKLEVAYEQPQNLAYNK